MSFLSKYRFIVAAFAALALMVVLISCEASNNSAAVQLGTAVAVEPLENDSLYKQTLERKFKVVTPENAMKFENLQPSRGQYDFRNSDTLVDFAEARGMQVRGHTLVWHAQLPDWLTQGSFTRDELIGILREHITTVVGHYRGRVAAWDVVNEAVDDNGTLRDNIWLQSIGPEYIEMAFQWAREADPQAKLFYNDYGGEGLGPKSGAIYTLVQGLVQRGVPIGGVGLQMHVSVMEYPDPQDVEANMTRLAALGLEVNITEMDVRIQDSSGTMEEKLTAQARVYQDMADACRTSRACKQFVVWGLTDNYSYTRQQAYQQEAPVLFDESYRPKPAYQAVQEALSL